ncbi:MAG TPA: hypothetical protein VFL58_15105 [Gaiellaceae bacterium]|nr:hypothetical protein [Gaiellaceae bacterium]
MRGALTSFTVAVSAAAAMVAGGWAVQAAALPPPAHADRVAADASVWLHDYRLVVDVFHVDHRRLQGACLRGWFPGPGGVKSRRSLLSLRSLETATRERRLMALAGCSGKLAQFLAGAAQGLRHLRVERSYAANQPAVALRLERRHDERLTLYVSPLTYRPLVAVVERDGRTATARLFLNRVTPRLLLRFGLPLESRLRSPR